MAGGSFQYVDPTCSCRHGSTLRALQPLFNLTPLAMFEVLSKVITAMRAGRAITVAPLAQRLTTQEAAGLLGVSRPTLIKLLEDGKIPFEQPGRHRRIRLDDLLIYRDQRRQERSKALDELVRQTEALGLYDEETPEAR